MEAAYSLPPAGRPWVLHPNDNRNITRATNNNDNDNAAIILIVISVEDSHVILQCDFSIKHFLLTASCFTL